jgi:hypothetical protein
METSAEESHSSASNGEFNVTVSDVANYEWEAVLIGAERPVCPLFATKLFQKSAQLKEAGDEKGSCVFRFLATVASPSLHSANIESPFTGVGLDNLSESNLEVLSDLLPLTRDPAMRARIGDLLWVKRKSPKPDYKAARIAAQAYLENFKRLNVAEDWTWDIEGFRRGFGLARILGKKNEPFPSYLSYVEELIGIHAPKCKEALCLQLFDLLLEHEVGDFASNGPTAEQAAKTIEEAGNFYLAQRCLEIAARLHTAAKNPDAARQARSKKGECLVRQAHNCVGRSGQGYATAAHFLSMAIECLRQAQASATRVQELHKQLRAWQEASLAEMKTTHHETDISKTVEAARNHVQGKSLVEAVLAFALGHPLSNPQNIRERIIEQAKKYPLSHLFGTVQMANDGRVIGHKPPVIDLHKGGDESAMQAEIFSQARMIDWPLRVSAYVDPCRFVILQEHRPSLRDLAFLVEHNPFIPPGHEVLFLRGIHAGFQGDMTLCAYVLIPQVEESIRHVLQGQGVVTSTLDSQLVQKERSLNELMLMPEAIQIFGDDNLFELRGVLCEKFGFDLRNRLAHGFLTTQECFGSEVLLAWWLILRLTAFPVCRELQRQNAELPTATKLG